MQGYRGSFGVGRGERGRGGGRGRGNVPRGPAPEGNRADAHRRQGPQGQRGTAQGGQRPARSRGSVDAAQSGQPPLSGGGGSNAPIGQIPSVRCETCWGYGHDYKGCHLPCMHCPENAIHRGQRCAYGEAAGMYPTEDRLVAAADTRGSQSETQSLHWRGADQYWQQHQGMSQNSGAQARVLRPGGLPMARIAVGNATATGSVVRSGSGGLAAIGPTAIVAPTAPRAMMKTKGPAFHPSLGEMDLPGFVPGVCPLGLHGKARNNWKRSERKRRDDYAMSLGIHPRQQREMGGAEDGLEDDSQAAFGGSTEETPQVKIEEVGENADASTQGLGTPTQMSRSIDQVDVAGFQPTSVAYVPLVSNPEDLDSPL